MHGIDLTDQGACADYVLAETSNEYMVRSRTRKLLLHRNAGESMFFDLERDPLELENLFGREDRSEEILVLREQLVGWPLFDDRVANHLDKNAPKCKAQNVADGDTGLYAHFKSFMTKTANNPIETTLDRASHG
jgi:hypothetical protein